MGTHPAVDGAMDMDMDLGIAARIGWKRAAGTALAAGAAALLYAWQVEPRRLQEKWFDVAVPGLPPELEGARIAHLTDLHAGMPGTRRSTIRRAVRRVAGWEPDLVALTGDFADQGRWERELALLRGLPSAAPAVAVLGNHDRLASRRATRGLVQRLEALGIAVLRNEHVAVPVRGGELVVVAVDDPSTDRDDLPAAMAGLPADPDPRRPAILLGHAPDIADRAPAGRFALVLAGHTHGGQIRISPLKRRTPLEVGMIAGGLDSPYPRGAIEVRGNPVFVSNGIGVSGVPFRFLAPPQVACFVLVRG